MQIIQQLEANGVFENTRVLRRNEFLTKAGQVNTQIYQVVEGSLRAFVIDNEEEQNIRLAYPNDLIVAMDAFLTEAPSALYIQAIKKTIVKVATKENFFRVIYQNEQNLRDWVNLLQGLVIQQMEREKDLLTSSPLERYLRVLRRSPQLFQEIPNKHIANYLRMTPETLSRLKKR